jgi:predicted anti-sigma-YlaC factor YlaD
MNCNEVREFLPDVASGVAAASAETQAHLRECPQCATQLENLRRTLALLEEWQTPEPSPYFDTRLYARLRAEMAMAPSRSWLVWLRKPALAGSLAALFFVGVSLFYGGQSLNNSPSAVTSWEMNVTAQPGTAVGDLQALDKNHDLYADFDVLDQLEVQQQEVTP